MIRESALRIGLTDVSLDADLGLPDQAQGLVIFVHGSGSSRHSSRNRAVATALQRRGFATLLFDLLTEAEDRHHENRFDVPKLTRRLGAVTRWAAAQRDFEGLPVDYFGASTGAAAALNSAGANTRLVAAVVSRGGRPDLAMENLSRVRAPTLLIVGGEDDVVIKLNEQALARLQCEKRLAIVPGATHLFEEPGTLEKVARLAGDWFVQHGTRAVAAPRPLHH